MQIKDYSGLIHACRQELTRLNLRWNSPRVLDWCERVTGKRSAHYLDEEHLMALLAKLQKEPNPEVREEEVA